MIDLTRWDGYPRTPKLWGEERLLINAEYCAKLLIIEPGYACSLHRHREKDETFYCLAGTVRIEWGRDPAFLFIEDKREGDCLRMLPGTYHRFWTPTNERAVLLEVSTTHSDDDVERLQESSAL